MKSEPGPPMMLGNAAAARVRLIVRCLDCRTTYWNDAAEVAGLRLVQIEKEMAASSKLMIVEAERRFPCRIKLGIPVGGFGGRLTEMHAWLDQNCGA